MNPEQQASSPVIKQQVVDALKKANNVLITVSQNPTIDQLASCIGLALMLNKMNKHATAIFSGNVPSTIEYLQPEKLLETNTDSLRDFIISLDRAKADKLRYKVEDNVVRIFITPYRTSLSQNDLVFSQGDFNVDAVVALGVDQREHLDLAIMQQGRILHDAVVIGISSGANPSNVGAINWHEPAASSICELIGGMSDSMQSGLLDAQIATALLTGIVAETDRFRNEKTSAKVMSMSAQLMAAGANQQLIAQQLTPQSTNDLSAPMAVTNGMPTPQKTEGDAFDVPQEGEGGPKEAAISLHIDPNSPAPAVQLPGEPTEEEIKKIKIDEQGILHDDVTTASAPTSNPDEGMINKPHKVIQPLSNEKPAATSSYITVPPERGGTLTAETQDNAAAEAPNPTFMAPAPTPILDRDSALPEASLPEAPVSSPLEPVPASAPDALPEQVAPELPAPELMAPAPVPEPEQPPMPSESDNQAALDQEAARKAVLEAVASGPEPIKPNPITALNAQPMDLSAQPEAPQPMQNPIAPPPLPPPIMPMPNAQLPTPDAMNLPSPAPQPGNPFNLPPAQ
jgi:hypothetical protein